MSDESDPAETPTDDGTTGTADWVVTDSEDSPAVTDADEPPVATDDPAAGTDAPADAAEESSTDADERDEIEAALAEVRRECRKVALVYASLDAVCVLLAARLAATLAGVPTLATDVAPATFDSLGAPAPSVGTAVALGVGLVAFAADAYARTRRPAAEQFEAANPEIAEALRTARDAARDDRSNPMVRALYADVLDRLRETSSANLLNATRLAATFLVAVAVSLATVQTAVVGFDLGLAGPTGQDVGGAGGGGDSGGQFTTQSAALQSGEEVLGDPTDVSAGSENLSAAVNASPGGEGDREWNYDSSSGGGSEDAAVDPQRAGFSSPERVEDAALVQRYAHELDGNATDS
ncbi:hypothetical protein M0R88_00345 [Halorussus gelatinilyticus]|uniref:Uncharacterized protein n=1 Tax=Halorussus gelatinilyticus TaxID=2937524 RepID=A0A8U0IIE5_9EURY|nr:hypothetical protein [Halorussus gelatinilyticus]UPW00568.1 hypothetical protein M0R88_00345 [Halorussus gelatinilyticus]